MRFPSFRPTGAEGVFGYANGRVFEINRRMRDRAKDMPLSPDPLYLTSIRFP